jgi:hypothetical protein
MVLSCFCLAPLSASAWAASTFDADSQGWSIVTADITQAGIPTQTTGAVTFHATGGHPDGYVSITDPDSFDTFFRAPAAFTGDQSAALGGTLSFDTITDAARDYNGADVVIKGNGKVLVYDIAPTADSNWSNVTLTIAPSANWRLNALNGPAATVADFQSALANVSELWITAEYHAGVETTGLDNVALSTVPEPAAVSAALGFAAAIGVRRRRSA